MTVLELQDAASAYDVLAPAYDLLGDPAAHDAWLDGLLDVAAFHGQKEQRALDVACGTGRSFIPMLRRGFEVVACDISTAMAERARAACLDAAPVHVADMRNLPTFGRFPLVTCLNDAVNHLTTTDDVLAAFEGLRANLTHQGLLIFDVNTLSSYRSRGDVIVEDDDRFVVWRATEARAVDAGEETVVRVEVFTRRLDGAWDRATSRQAHRHYPLDEVVRLLDEARLQVVATYGQRRGGVLDPVVDERHHKVLFVAARLDRDNTRRH